MPLDSAGGSMGRARSGKVHAGAAGVSLAVQGGASRHVGGHVGDGDVEPVALRRGFLDAYGIVEVAGGLAVDGEGRQPAQVPASAEVRGTHGGAMARGLLSGLGRELVGQAVAEDHRLRLDLGIVGGSQQPLEPGFRRRVAAAVAGHLHRRHLAGSDRRRRRQGDRRGDARVHGHHQDTVPVGLDHADDAALSPLQHFHHVALAVAVALLLRTHQHPVAVHHPPHLPAAEVDVLHSLLVRHHETEAVGMPLHHPRHHAGGLGEGVVVLVETDHLALVDQLLERVDHGFPCLLAEPFPDLPQAEAVARSGKH